MAVRELQIGDTVGHSLDLVALSPDILAERLVVMGESIEDTDACVVLYPVTSINGPHEGLEFLAMACDLRRPGQEGQALPEEPDPPLMWTALFPED